MVLLSDRDREIRRRLAAGESRARLAADYGLTTARIGQIGRVGVTPGAVERDTRDEEIRRRRREGETLQAIATDHGITRQRVRQICAKGEQAGPGKREQNERRLLAAFRPSVAPVGGGGAWLAARTTLGLTQGELGALIGRSPKTIIDCEQGRREPDKAAALAMAYMLRDLEIGGKPPDDAALTVTFRRASRRSDRPSHEHGGALMPVEVVTGSDPAPPLPDPPRVTVSRLQPRLAGGRAAGRRKTRAG